jgi:ATP-binding cassette subfamily B protein
VAPGERLRSLEVRGLTARHAASGRGVAGVDLTVARGSLVVVTGAVGSGKSTLVRALLGLIPIESGMILWNGAPVDDPGGFLVPPRAAYAGQVSRLFSTTLAENLGLGWPAGDDQLWSALGVAQLDAEVAGMRLGLATVVGPRGSRLSGGQSQRAAIARAVVRDADLLVLDDVSSALDLRTEERLWEVLRERRTTCLATGHRRAILERADHVVVLEAGRVAASGPLDRLRRESPELRRLWQPELLDEPAV